MYKCLTQFYIVFSIDFKVKMVLCQLNFIYKMEDFIYIHNLNKYVKERDVPIYASNT